MLLVLRDKNREPEPHAPVVVADFGHLPRAVNYIGVVYQRFVGVKVGRNVDLGQLEDAFSVVGPMSREKDLNIVRGEFYAVKIFYVEVLIDLVEAA